MNRISFSAGDFAEFRIFDKKRAKNTKQNRSKMFLSFSNADVCLTAQEKNTINLNYDGKSNNDGKCSAGIYQKAKEEKK